MSVFTKATLAAATAAMFGSGLADLASAADCCVERQDCCPRTKIVYRCCTPKKACHDDCDQPATPPLVAFPPLGPVVESVPILSSPVLLAQDRLVLSATQLQSARVLTADVATARATRFAETNSNRSCDERLAAMEQHVGQIDELIRKQNMLLEQMQRRLDSIAPPSK